MNRTFILLTMIVALLAGFPGPGCNTLPDAPKLADSKPITVLTITPDDEEELEAVKAVEVARVAYRHSLRVLEAYYMNTADLMKLTWARRETKNLDNAQVFRWAGLDVVPPESTGAAKPQERRIVEATIAAREAWIQSLDELAALYEGQGDSAQTGPDALKLRAVRNARQRLDPVHTYLYFLDAEIPGPKLRPTNVIPDADQTYAEALRLHNEGKGILRFFVTTDYDKQRQALRLFREVIAKHPRSTRIALCAYYIGEIYKEYFNEHYRAVHWYRRAWQWDPYIIEPARFQAATVYDVRLQEKQKAVECYRMSIDADPWRLGNEQHAKERIPQLLQMLSDKKK